MKPLDAKLLKKFLDISANHLKGKWLLVGGTLLPAVGLDIRSTIDIDLVGLGDKERAQNLELMEIAEKLELSVETINQAADFFVKKIGPTKADLILLKKGKSATIYRPTVEFFWKLKAARLSEADLIDCQYYYHYCLSQKDPIEKAELKKAINFEFKQKPTADRHQRLQKLLSLISFSSP